MSSIAIITARGGSKRIPQKNIKEFCGKPIIAYSIEAALESKIFDEVMVSTDSEEIADVARKYGATVPFLRSEKNANDFADTTDVLLEVIDEYKKRGIEYDELCCIYPTAPFVTSRKLIEAYKILMQEDVNNVIPMVTFSFPPQRGMTKKDKYIEPACPEFINCRSQDLEEIYHDCGQFYWLKTNEFRDNPNFLCNKTVPYFVPETEVQDIDNESDWILAEIKYRYMRNNSK